MGRDTAAAETVDGTEEREGRVRECGRGRGKTIDEDEKVEVESRRVAAVLRAGTTTIEEVSIRG